jgi:hypothetical protein
VRLVLTGVVDFSAFDPIKAQLVAANGANAGNALDQLLDQLAKRLRDSKSSIADLSMAIGNNVGTSVVQTILAPASTSCAGLRTGNYHFLTAGGYAGLQVNAATTTASFKSGFGPSATPAPDVPLTASPTDPCRFDATVSGAPFVAFMGKAGMGVVVLPNTLPIMVVPVQTIPLTDLAGSWNGLGYQRDSVGASFASNRATFDLDATGKMTFGADCSGSGFGTCTAWPAGELGTFTDNPDGGLTLTNSTDASRAVAFKGTDGVVTLVITNGNALLIASKKVIRTLPTVNTSNSYWEITAQSDLATSTSIWRTTTTGVDTAAQTYTRMRDDGRADTWKQNFPGQWLALSRRSQRLGRGHCHVSGQHRAGCGNQPRSDQDLLRYFDESPVMASGGANAVDRQMKGRSWSGLFLTHLIHFVPIKIRCCAARHGPWSSPLIPRTPGTS